MACTGRWAEAWEYASFWCVGNILIGAHDGAGPVDAALQDADGNFITLGLLPNVGMVLYNTTQNTSGPVVAVANTTLTATGVTWANGDTYRIVPITAVEIAQINHYLDIAASDIHAALAASAQCDCSWSSWARGYVVKLNIIDAASYHHCNCAQPKTGPRERDALLTWMGSQLKMLAMGELDLCAGATGKNWPSIGFADQAYTESMAVDMIIKDLMRGS